VSASCEIFNYDEDEDTSLRKIIRKIISPIEPIISPTKISFSFLGFFTCPTIRIIEPVIKSINPKIKVYSKILFILLL
jgi:hypothetical protein